MPRTKRRTVKRSTGEMNITSNVTMASEQPKNVKDILEEFESESIVAWL